MKKEEFLRGLKEALSGDVPPSVVRENLRYYDDYIRAEVQKGRSEQEVVEELGDPRLIARTIEAATPEAAEGAYEPYSSGGFYQSEDGASTTEEHAHVHYYDLNKWYWKLAAVAIIVLIVTVILTIMTGLLSILIPLIPVLVLVFLLFHWFSGNGM